MNSQRNLNYLYRIFFGFRFIFLYFARRRFRSVGDRSPTCGTGGLNLVLDVLAQLLEDAFDVLGRAVIGKCP